jgi:hypothetical protein
VVPERKRPYPRRTYWRSVNLEDAAHNFGIGTHVMAFDAAGDISNAPIR